MKDTFEKTVGRLTDFVLKKPIAMIDFDMSDSSAILGSRNGTSQFTIAKHHDYVSMIKTPSIFIANIKESQYTSMLYIGVISDKSAVSTIDSRISIKSGSSVHIASFDELTERINDQQIKKIIKDNVPQTRNATVLSPMASVAIINVLSEDKRNFKALERVSDTLNLDNSFKATAWAQRDAVRLAMICFGQKEGTAPHSITLTRDTDSCLVCLHEDNVIMHDVNVVPGFTKIRTSYTGKAIFRNSREQLTVFTANKLPLEQAFGVDLIYFNDTKGNIVMVQYKMLEYANGDDWVFRPDSQFKSELSKMHISNLTRKADDYRMCDNPFYFKFVRRRDSDVSKSIHLSLGHLNHYLSSGESFGPHDGTRISYNALKGQYLREGDLVKLIQSGYIGTHRADSDLLIQIIEKIAEGDRALVIGWQQPLSQNKGGGNNHG
jgi:DNA-binding TFAR19-related protein (PDSD5 family)